MFCFASAKTLFECNFWFTQGSQIKIYNDTTKIFLIYLAPKVIYYTIMDFMCSKIFGDSSMLNVKRQNLI
jgi:hypothetical protein